MDMQDKQVMIFWMEGFQVPAPPHYWEIIENANMFPKINPGWQGLTLKHLETYGCTLSTVATDALVLKHQVISIHSAD